MLRLWGRNTSINVQKVTWTLGEIGLPHERIDAGGPFGGLDTPEFGRLNPNRRVPVIDDNGFVLWESNAIVRYLADTYARGALAPEGRYSFARADQWAEWAATTLYHDLIMICFIGLVRVPRARRDTDAISAAAARLSESLAVLDAALSGKAYILGDQLTFADILVGTYMYRYYAIEIERAEHANVAAWYERLTQRAAYRQHVMIDFSSLKVPGA